MRVLVTGGGGYIGSVMVSMLTSGGHEVLVLDDLSRGHEQAVVEAELVIADLEDLLAVRDTCDRFRPDATMHFAAHSLVEESVADPLTYFRTNVGGTLNLLRSLVETGCRYFIFSSTAAVYGIPSHVPIVEEEPTDPINPYGMTKLIVEQVLGELSRVGVMRFVSLRYFNAAGADLMSDLGEDHEPETHLIPRVIFAATGREPRAVIYGTDYPTPDGTCVRDYIHIIDLCRAHLLALESLAGGGAGGIYNLGNGNGFSVREVIEAVSRVSGRDFEVVEAERREGDPPTLVASSERIREELGWEPAFETLDSIVETAWKWHTAHPGGYV